MTLMLDGTLDAHSRDDLTRMTPGQAAQEQYHTELERYASPHEWWRIAALPDGEPAGFVIPAHNGYNPIIAYLGVVPARRGRRPYSRCACGGYEPARSAERTADPGRRRRR